MFLPEIFVRDEFLPDPEETRASFLAAIDHDAHAFDRETGLGDVGGEHDLAFATAAGLDRRVLLLHGQLAEQR